MLQQKKPTDLVIATGKQSSVKYFINLVAKELNLKIKWSGKGKNEKAYDQFNNCIVACDPSYFRPLDVNTLLGSSLKARKILGWKSKTSLKELVKEMVNEELKSLNLNND